MRPRIPLLAVLAAAAALVLGEGFAGASSGATGVVRLAAVGDMALAPAPDGGKHLFSGVRRSLTGDVVLGNLEGTLATGGHSKCGSGSTNCFAFRAPPSYAAVLRRAGFTVLNLANNHAYDFGPQGQVETIAALRAEGLRYTGRPGEVAYVEAGGARVALIGFASYPWAQSLIDLEAARSLVRTADTRADIVVVTMHAGAEGKDQAHMRRGTEWFLGENRGNPIAFSHAVVDAGADVVVGHGPHVLRGIEWYRGRLIAYSLGNFVGYGTLNVSGVSGVSSILQVRLRRNGSWVGGRLVPVTLAPAGIPALDKTGEATRLVAALSREDFGRSGVRITSKGVLRPRR